MKQLIYIACFLFFSNGFGQDTLNHVDANGKKQGHWIYYGKDRPESGIPLEGKVEEGNYIDDRKEGTWIKYHNNGITPKIIGVYENNRPKGAYHKYYENGCIKETGTFDKNKYNNTVITYTENGLKESVSYYDTLGNKHTIRTEYTLDGNVNSLNTSILNATAAFPSDSSGYHASGRIKEFSNCTFKNESTYNSEYHATYNENGKEQGVVQYFYSNGQLEFEYIAIDGTATGKATRYYENGDVKELIEYSANGEVLKSTEYPMIHPPILNTRLPEKPPKIDPILLNTKGIKWQPNGYNRIYTDDNEIWLDGVFKNGQLWDGKMCIYDLDGILLRVKLYQNGLYFSDGQL